MPNVSSCIMDYWVSDIQLRLVWLMHSELGVFNQTGNTGYICRSSTVFQQWFLWLWWCSCVCNWTIVLWWLVSSLLAAVLLYTVEVWVSFGIPTVVITMAIYGQIKIYLNNIILKEIDAPHLLSYWRYMWFFINKSLVRLF